MKWSAQFFALAWDTCKALIITQLHTNKCSALIFILLHHHDPIFEVCDVLEDLHAQKETSRADKESLMNFQFRFAAQMVK